jgi:hypothetical protein
MTGITYIAGLIGEAKWLTVVSPNDLDRTELLLEPNGNPTAEI